MQISNSAAINGYKGMQEGFNRLDAASQQLANPNQTDKTQALLELPKQTLQVEASAKAVKAHDDMIGSIIDIMA